MGASVGLRFRHLLALSALVCAVVLSAPSAASASHAPAGTGGCADHTVTCYPNCRYEWTGNRGSTVDPPVDGGFCTLPSFVYVGDAAGRTTQPVSGSVSVSNLPATQAVAGTVTVVNPTGQRLNVAAVCDGTAPCVANGQAEAVRITNTEDDPVRIGGNRFATAHQELLAAGGLGLFFVAAGFVSKLRKVD